MKLRFATVLTALILTSSWASAAGRPADQRPGDPAINARGAIRGVHYRSLTGGAPPTPKALFGSSGKPRGRDVRQGIEGDCYLDAAAAPYAQFHPQVIKGVFLTKRGTLRTSPEGRPTARYFVKDRDTNRFKQAKHVTYDGRAPVRANGKTALNRLVNGRIWSPMLEYTYTKFRNQQGGAPKSDNPKDDRSGYNRVFNGGYASTVMQALTGKKAREYEVGPHNEEEIWALLRAAQDENKVVVAGSTDQSTLRSRVYAEIARGDLDGRAKKMRFDDDKRWYPGHAYSAWGDKTHPFVFEKNGERMIRLRNPYGSVAPGGIGKQGIAAIPFKQFVLRYDTVYIGSPTAKAD
jgi:hypothetical protein